MVKTFKREVAVALLLWLVYLSIWGDTNVLEILVWPVFFFAGGAFGLDAFSKQLQQPSAFFTSRRGAERSG